MITINEDLELQLGTPEAAVRSCVRLMSTLFEQPERYVAYYLDRYYQVRCLYESSLRKEDPVARHLVKIEDLYALLSDLFARELGREQETTQTGKPAASAFAENIAEAEPEPEAPKKNGAYAKYKMRVMTQLTDARAQGRTIAEIANASDGAISDKDVIAALNARQLPIVKWKAIETALQSF